MTTFIPALNKKKRCKIVICVGVLLFVTFFILYSIPEQIEIQGIGVSENDPGDTVNVSVSVKRWKSLFRPTQIIGTVVVGDTDYISMASLGKGYDIYTSNSILKNIKLKLQNFRYDLFVRADVVEKQMQLYQDTVEILELSEQSISFSRFISSSGNSVVTYHLNDING